MNALPPGLTGVDPMPYGYRRWNGAVWADIQVDRYNHEIARIWVAHTAGYDTQRLVDGLYMEDSGKLWVIENVVGSPLKNPITLCGQMFGLELYRHRLFETSFDISAPYHPAHIVPASKAGHWRPGTIISVAGHVAPIAKARQAMGIDWMTRDELGEAIPPAYTAYVGFALAIRLSPTRTEV